MKGRERKPKYRVIASPCCGTEAKWEIADTFRCGCGNLFNPWGGPIRANPETARAMKAYKSKDGEDGKCKA